MDDVIRKVCANDVKNLVVRTTTNFEVDEYALARIISETTMDQFPIGNSFQPGNTSEYNVPQLSTPSWSQGVLQ